MGQPMLDRPDPRGLGFVLEILVGLDKGTHPASELGRFLRGEPTPGREKWQSKPGKTDRFGLALDLMIKVKSETIPLEDVEAFSQGYPTHGSKYWTVGKRSRTVAVPRHRQFETYKMFGRITVIGGDNLCVGSVGEAFRKRRFPERYTGDASQVAIRPIRRKTSAEDIFDAIGGQKSGLVSIPEYHAALSEKQKRKENGPRSSLMGFVHGLKEDEIWILYSNWLIMGGFGVGPDCVDTLLLSAQKNRALNYLVGIEVVTRTD